MLHACHWLPPCQQTAAAAYLSRHLPPQVCPCLAMHSYLAMAGAGAGVAGAAGAAGAAIAAAAAAEDDVVTAAAAVN